MHNTTVELGYYGTRSNGVAVSAPQTTCPSFGQQSQSQPAQASATGPLEHTAQGSTTPSQQQNHFHGADAVSMQPLHASTMGAMRTARVVIGDDLFGAAAAGRAVTYGNVRQAQRRPMCLTLVGGSEDPFRMFLHASASTPGSMRDAATEQVLEVGGSHGFCSCHDYSHAIRCEPGAQPL